MAKRSVVRQRYCLMSLLVYSLAPLSQEAYGCAKYTPVSSFRARCWRSANSFRYRPDLCPYQFLHHADDHMLVMTFLFTFIAEHLRVSCTIQTRGKIAGHQINLKRTYTDTNGYRNGFCASSFLKQWRKGIKEVEVKIGVSHACR